MLSSSSNYNLFTSLQFHLLLTQHSMCVQPSYISGSTCFRFRLQ